jgi:hypothetical protein
MDQLPAGPIDLAARIKHLATEFVGGETETIVSEREQTVSDRPPTVSGSEGKSPEPKQRHSGVAPPGRMAAGTHSVPGQAEDATECTVWQLGETAPLAAEVTAPAMVPMLE